MAKKKYVKVGKEKVRLFEFSSIPAELVGKKGEISETLGKFGKVMIRSAGWDKAMKKLPKRKKKVHIIGISKIGDGSVIGKSNFKKQKKK